MLPNMPRAAIQINLLDLLYDRSNNWLAKRGAAQFFASDCKPYAQESSMPPNPIQAAPKICRRAFKPPIYHPKRGQNYGKEKDHRCRIRQKYS